MCGALSGSYDFPEPQFYNLSKGDNNGIHSKGLLLALGTATGTWEALSVSLVIMTVLTAHSFT